MTARDYLAELTDHIGDSPLNGSGLTAEMLGALVGIGQQLRRIADVMERPFEPVTTVPAGADPVALVAKLRWIIAEQRRALGGVVPEPEAETLPDPADAVASVRAYLAREGRL
ncbi:MAG TPA: hypothetical protein VIL68_12560 [Propionibacteriaceae bacterium]